MEKRYFFEHDGTIVVSYPLDDGSLRYRFDNIGQKTRERITEMGIVVNPSVDIYILEGVMGDYFYSEPKLTEDYINSILNGVDPNFIKYMLRGLAYKPKSDLN